MVFERIIVLDVGSSGYNIGLNVCDPESVPVSLNCGENDLLLVYINRYLPNGLLINVHALVIP